MSDKLHANSDEIVVDACRMDAILISRP